MANVFLIINDDESSSLQGVVVTGCESGFRINLDVCRRRVDQDKDFGVKSLKNRGIELLNVGHAKVLQGNRRIFCLVRNLRTRINQP